MQLDMSLDINKRVKHDDSIDIIYIKSRFIIISDFVNLLKETYVEHYVQIDVIYV